HQPHPGSHTPDPVTVACDRADHPGDAGAMPVGIDPPSLAVTVVPSALRVPPGDPEARISQIGLAEVDGGVQHGDDDCGRAGRRGPFPRLLRPDGLERPLLAVVW